MKLMIIAIRHAVVERARVCTGPPQTSPPRTTGAAPADSAISTSSFIDRMVIGDMFDVQAARLAEQKGESGEKTFAQREVSDHTKFTSDIKGMVNSGKVHAGIPTRLDGKHQQKLGRLQTLSGKQFDQATTGMRSRTNEDMGTSCGSMRRTGIIPMLSSGRLSAARSEAASHEYGKAEVVQSKYWPVVPPRSRRHDHLIRLHYKTYCQPALCHCGATRGEIVLSSASPNNASSKNGCGGGSMVTTEVSA